MVGSVTSAFKKFIKIVNILVKGLNLVSYVNFANKHVKRIIYLDFKLKHSIEDNESN